MVSSIRCGCHVELECLTNWCHGQCQYSMFGKDSYVEVMTPTGQMSKSLVILPTALQVSTSADNPTPEHREACYQQSMISCSHAHRLAIATIHHCSPPLPPIYCIAPSKHPFPWKCPLPILHLKFKTTFCASISLPMPTYLSINLRKSDSSSASRRSNPWDCNRTFIWPAVVGDSTL